ncbi:MAG: hypothetical protein KGD73_04830 [Candidatus Lokiarchaeota archaeon]|nr:hypothetical protein [Candidatus Lokiarchaeota archaeon]
MTSISSANNIKERTTEFCSKLQKKSPNKFIEKELFSEIIAEFIRQEYDLIPSKERIGKGAVYISKYIAKALFQFLHKNSLYGIEDYYQFGKVAFQSGEITDNSHLQHFALLFLAEYIYNYPEHFDSILNDVLSYANNDKWEIRESTAYIIISAMRKIPSHTLEILTKLISNQNENIRRLVTESLRPSSTLKWLRDPLKNDQILDLLTLLNKDPSIYVRKSVGNNLKDLSKYMPYKILKLMMDWIEISNIKVHDDLASEIGMSQEQKRLLWTIKHALRWLKKNNPEFHPKIKNILGNNYILYFDEKRNRLAKPF